LFLPLSAVICHCLLFSASTEDLMLATPNFSLVYSPWGL